MHHLTRPFILTLLITMAGLGYALACSDMRISVERNGNFISADETFNKHIVFHSGGVTGSISYTGVASWTVHGRTVNLYDVISESIADSARANLGFGSLAKAIIDSILTELEAPVLQTIRGSLDFELHIIGRHQALAFPFIAVISTNRRTAPWSAQTDIQLKYEYQGISLYLKLAETPEVIFGGRDQDLTPTEKQRVFDAVCRGADAFNMAQLAARLIERASTRTAAVGPKSVSIVLPEKGLIDTNLWEQAPTGINAFVPRMVLSDGTMMGPSVFPIEMQAITKGYLPKQSLFAKSLIASSHKRSVRRRIFRLRDRKAFPGVMGLLMLALFGKIPDGYEDFGLRPQPNPNCAAGEPDPSPS